jgi:hypothetical protein
MFFLNHDFTRGQERMAASATKGGSIKSLIMSYNQTDGYSISPLKALVDRAA